MKLHLFGCGGGGIGATSRFMKGYDATREGVAEVIDYYVDTSDANARKNELKKKPLIIQTSPDEANKEARDGGGKVRNAHAKEIARQMPAIIGDVGYNDVSIVVMTSSGGSGSTIGQTAISQLLGRERMVIGAMIMSFDDAKSRENTLASVETLENIANVRGIPVVIYLVDNEEGEAKADASIESLIRLLSVFFSGNNQRLDTSDLANFLNFSKPGVTSHKPRLAFLNAYTGFKDEEIVAAEQDTTAIAIASLYADEVRKAPINSDYSCHGIHSLKLTDDKLPNDAHLVISASDVEEKFREVQKRVHADKERNATAAKYNTFVRPANNTNDDGLIF